MSSVALQSLSGSCESVEQLQKEPEMKIVCDVMEVLWMQKCLKKIFLAAVLSL